MKKLLYVILFLCMGISLMLLGISSPAHATTPTISGVSGSVSTGQTLTITGTNMMNENKTNWDAWFSAHPNAYGFEGASGLADGYQDVRGGAACPNCGSYDSTVKLMGSKSIKFHIQGAFSSNAESYNAIQPASGNFSDQWVRFYARWNSANNLWVNSHIKMIDSAGATAQYYFQPTGLGSMPSTMVAKAGADTNSANIPGGQLQNNRWYLFEIHWKTNSQPYVFDAWIDNQKVLTWAPSPQGGLLYHMIGLINACCSSNSQLSIDHWWDGYAVSSTRIYPSSTIEIANGSNYATATKVYQEPIYLSDGSVQIKANISGLGSGPYYLFVTNNRQERSTAYNLSGAGGPPPSDTTAPTVNTYSMPSSSSSLTVPITSITATDNVGVSGYLVTESAAAPSAIATGWTSSAPTSYTVTSAGSKTLYAWAKDAAGNVSASKSAGVTVTIPPPPPPPPATVLFQEDFEDTNFPSRGWYDGTYNSSAITASQHYTGTHAYECHFTAGSNYCVGKDPRRMLFTATDSVYVSYWMKLSSNWVGSGTTYHPHIINLMTDQNGVWDGLAITNTTAYLELNGVKPRIGLQDGANINMSNLNQNLCATNENRAVNGCNGTCDSDPWDAPAGCYDLTGAGDFTNGKLYSPNVALTTNAWHHIEAYMKMNSVSGGKGQKDGVMQMWVDGSQVMNFTDIIYRTNQHPTMKWNQFIMAPYNAPPGGSPVDQYFWIDNLTVGTGPSAPIVPNKPLGLQ